MKRRRLIVPIVALMIIILLNGVVSASQEIVWSGTRTGGQSRLRLAAVLFKDTGEIDPNYDYYALKATLQDIKWQNDPSIDPIAGWLTIGFSTYAEEIPANHQPTAGDYTGQTSLNFNYVGIGFSLYLPSQRVEFYPFGTIPQASNAVKWNVYTITKPIFTDYAEFGIGVRVPQGKKVSIGITGWVQWNNGEQESTALSGTVGGIIIPMNKIQLLTPYIVLASTILAATVASAVYVKRVKRRKEE
jgi:hypothetical protein